MKKLLSTLFVVLVWATCGAAQTLTPAPVPPDVTILKMSWHLATHSSALDADPFEANVEFNQAQRQQQENDIQNAARAKGSQSREAAPQVRVNRASDMPAKMISTYVYKAKIKNAGTKTIRAVDWAYLFLDPDTQAELGRHLCTSKIKIRPGQVSDLVGSSTGTQTSTVNAQKIGKGMGEQVVIYRIEYDDGSVWQSPAK